MHRLVRISHEDYPSRWQGPPKMRGAPLAPPNSFCLQLRFWGVYEHLSEAGESSHVNCLGRTAYSLWNAGRANQRVVWMDLLVWEHLVHIDDTWPEQACSHIDYYYHGYILHKWHVMLLFIATDVLGYVTCGLWAPLLGSALDVCSLCMYAYSLSHCGNGERY